MSIHFACERSRVQSPASPPSRAAFSPYLFPLLSCSTYPPIHHKQVHIITVCLAFIDHFLHNSAVAVSHHGHSCSTHCACVMPPVTLLGGTGYTTTHRLHHDTQVTSQHTSRQFLSTLSKGTLIHLINVPFKNNHPELSRMQCM